MISRMAQKKNIEAVDQSAFLRSLMIIDIWVSPLLLSLLQYPKMMIIQIFCNLILLFELKKRYVSSILTVT